MNHWLPINNIEKIDERKPSGDCNYIYYSFIWVIFTNG